MHDPAGVGVFEGPCHAHQDPSYRVDVPRLGKDRQAVQLERRLARSILSTLIQDFAQSEAVDERHGEEDDSAVLSEPVGRQDCRVVHPRPPFGLAPEPSRFPGVATARGHE